MDWIFDGIGTEIISIIISLIVGSIGGGAIGYKFGIKRNSKQKQVAGNDSKQRQELKIGVNDIGTVSSKNKSTIKQSQKAGDNAIQTQIGGINDDRR